MPDLWVVWIPTGREVAVDEGACVGPEWWCRKKARSWLREDDVIEKVYMAPIPTNGVVTAEVDSTEEIVVAFSDEIAF